MVIALIWLLGALMNPSAALRTTAPGSSQSLAPPVGLLTVSGDQRWRQMDFGVKPHVIKRSRREVLAAWLQADRSNETETNMTSFLRKNVSEGSGRRNQK